MEPEENTFFCPFDGTEITEVVVFDETGFSFDCPECRWLDKKIRVEVASK